MEREVGEPKFEVLQVKEKFGGLRYAVNHANDAIRKHIAVAELESWHTCEVCGQAGQLREGAWLKTLCDKHAEHTSAFFLIAFADRELGKEYSMDTKTLVVGQEVYIFSGLCNHYGKVVAVGPEGARVKIDGEMEVFNFDKEGKGRVEQGTEYGPWYIDDMPFAEREALHAKAARRFREWEIENRARNWELRKQSAS
jgi:hypothetical protein